MYSPSLATFYLSIFCGSKYVSVLSKKALLWLQKSLAGEMLYSEIKRQCLVSILNRISAKHYFCNRISTCEFEVGV